MSRYNGPVKVLSDDDATPTDLEGGYAGGDSTAAALRSALETAGKAVGAVDNLAGTATTLPAGSSATVTVSGDLTSKVIEFGIPEGQPGMGYAEGQELLTQNATTLAAAQQSAVSADNAATRAEGAEAAKLEVPDANTALMIGNPSTETHAALKADSSPVVAKGDLAINAADYPSIVDAVAAVNAAGRGILHVSGTHTTNTPLLFTVPAQVVGVGSTQASIKAGATFPAARHLVEFYRSSFPLTGVKVSGVTIDGGTLNALHLNNCRNSSVTDVRLINAGQDGLGGIGSWNIVMSNVMGFGNGRDGLNLATLHAITLDGCHGISNGRHGINAPNRSKVLRATTEHNGVAGTNVENAKAVSIDSGYVEPDTGAPPGRNHVRIVNSQDVQVRDASVLELLTNGTCILVDGSKRVAIECPSGNWPVLNSLNQEYPWRVASDAQGSRGIVVTSTCEDVTLRGIMPVPMYVGGDGIVDEPDRRDGYIRANLIGPDGDFTSAGAGLAAGWAKTGTVSFTALTTLDGRNVQQFTAGAGNSGIVHPVTLDANTTYSVGAIVEADGDAYFSRGANSLGTEIYHLHGPRLVVLQFTTGSTPWTQVGINGRNTGTTVKVSHFKVVKGAFSVSTFPKFGQYESTTA